MTHATAVHGASLVAVNGLLVTTAELRPTLQSQDSMKRPLSPDRQPLNKYRFSNIADPKSELRAEINSNNNIRVDDRHSSWESDYYVDTLKIADGIDSHDKIMAFCNHFHLPKNYSHVLNDKEFSSHTFKGGLTSCLPSVLLNMPYITEIVAHRPYGISTSDDIKDEVSALQSTKHLKSFKILLDGVYQGKAINDIIRALSGHTGLENLEIRHPMPRTLKISALCELLSGKEHLARLSLTGLHGTKESAMQLAQILGCLPVLETLSIGESCGDELKVMLDEWVRLQESNSSDTFPSLRNLIIDDRDTTKVASFVKKLPRLKLLRINGGRIELNKQAGQDLLSYAAENRSLVQVYANCNIPAAMNHALRNNRKFQVFMAGEYLTKVVTEVLTHTDLPSDIGKLLVQKALGRGTPADMHKLRFFNFVNRKAYYAFASLRRRWLNFQLRQLVARKHGRKSPDDDGDHEEFGTDAHCIFLSDTEDAKIMQEFSITYWDEFDGPDLGRLRYMTAPIP